MSDVTSSLIIVPADAAPQAEDPIITQLKAWKREDEAVAYAQAEDYGKVCQRNMDTGRWLIGELANFVETEYRDRSIETFAEGIHVDVERVKEYRTMARFWTFSARAEFSEVEGVTYSHMRAAKGLGDLDAAKAFLLDCVLNKWTVMDARREVNARNGKPSSEKVFDGPVTFEAQGDLLVVDRAALPVLAGVQYRVVLYKVTS